MFFFVNMQYTDIFDRCVATYVFSNISRMTWTSKNVPLKLKCSTF